MYDIRDYEQPDWQPTAVPEPIPVEKPSTWLAAGIAAVGVAIVAAIVFLLVVVWTGGTSASGPAETYRTSATPDYLAFSAVAGIALGDNEVSISSNVDAFQVLANNVCGQLQLGTPIETLYAQGLGDAVSATSSQSRAIIDAAHAYVCTGR